MKPTPIDLLSYGIKKYGPIAPLWLADQAMDLALEPLSPRIITRPSPKRHMVKIERILDEYDREVICTKCKELTSMMRDGAKKLKALHDISEEVDRRIRSGDINIDIDEIIEEELKKKGLE